MLTATQRFADEIAARPNQGDVAALLADLKQLAAFGLLTAPLPVAYGGLGLGTETGGQLPLLRILAAIGGGDLVLGRLYEGHVNALVLVASYGTAAQLKRAMQDAHDGMLFGIWNTGAREILRLESVAEKYTFKGVKLLPLELRLFSVPLLRRNGLSKAGR